MRPDQRPLPALMPIRVPWQISASAAFLRPESSLIQSGQSVRVDFVAYFQLHDTPGAGHSGTELLVVQPPPPFRANPEPATASHHLVRIEFDHCHALRVLPSVSESRVIDERLYDWSNVPGRLLPGESVEISIQRIRTLWRESEICPNPRMYEVTPSQWLEQLSPPGQEQWRHYLLAGSDEYVEVIAQKWKWQLGQAVFPQAHARL